MLTGKIVDLDFLSYKIAKMVTEFSIPIFWRQ